MSETGFTLAEELLLLALDDESGELRGHPRYLLEGAAIMELVVRGLVRPIAPQSPEWLPALHRVARREQLLLMPTVIQPDMSYQQVFENTPSFVWQMLVDKNADISLPPLEASLWSKVQAETRREAVFNLRSVIGPRLSTDDRLFQFGITRPWEAGILYKAEKRLFLGLHHTTFPTEKRDVKQELREEITDWLLRKRSSHRNDTETDAERSRMLGWLVWKSGLLPDLISRDERDVAEWHVIEAARLSTDIHSAISCINYAITSE